MPKVVIGKTRLGAVKERIARRQAQSDDVVDNRRLRMVEHRLGEDDAAGRVFRPHGQRRHDGEKCGGRIGPDRNVGVACRRSPRSTQGRGKAGKDCRRGKERHGPARKPDRGQDRQRQRIEDGPTHDRRERQRRRSLCDQPARQWPADRQADQRLREGAEQDIRKGRHRLRRRLRRQPRPARRRYQYRLPSDPCKRPGRGWRPRHGAGNLAIMIIDNFGTPPAAPTRLRDAFSARWRGDGRRVAGPADGRFCQTRCRAGRIVLRAGAARHPYR